ncbi:hypothetical protein KCP75_24835 [Salmonella enterica subsp. enterica]|nr:hypothetical protein KCP75_24835 [Salmonella enterica subsp. enterica]
MALTALESLLAHHGRRAAGGDCREAHCAPDVHAIKEALAGAAVRRYFYGRIWR